MPTPNDPAAADPALTLAALAEPSRKEVTKEDDVKNFMAQIKALETKAPPESQALPEGASDPKPVTVTQPPFPPAPLGGTMAEAPPSAAPPAAPLQPTQPAPKAPQEPPWRHSIVEVIDKTSRHFGQLFKLGDIKNGKAHGYAFKEHGGREYITVGVDQIITHSPAKIRVGKYCSPKWVTDHRE